MSGRCGAQKGAIDKTYPSKHSPEFTGLLHRNIIQINMDGKYASRNDVFVERTWRTVKDQ